MTDAKHTRGAVVSRRDVTDELWVVRLRPEERIEFQPGQYVTVGLPGDGKLIERPYSVASSPREPELEFFLEIVREGQLSPHLYQVPEGGEVYLRRTAHGRLLFDSQSGNPNHLMVATVTGVAPFLSMLREFAAQEEGGGTIPYSIALIHAASLPVELAYREELSLLARRHGWFQYIPTVSRFWLEPEWQGEVGRCEDIVRKHLDRLRFTPRDATAYLCGNPVMIQNVEGVLRRAGFSKKPIREEFYWERPKTGAHESVSGRSSE